MHILVVNDDGPPSRRLSPYIQPLVSALQAAGHLVSVAIPAASRSWIGKAHLIEASLKATYVPPQAFHNDGTWNETYTHTGPNDNDTDSPTNGTTTTTRATPSSGNPNDEWVVITNGTPASCVQLGLFNLFPDRPPIDLVISGPNHGRNASTIYNLSSGTVGGALEAATCGKRGIAISFGSKEEQPALVIAAAARLAVRVVNHLIAHWDERVELYNINVPMRDDVESRPVLWTRTLPYYWARGYLYAEADNPNCSEQANGVSETQQRPATTLKQRDFKWGAQLLDMKKALQASEEGTDAHTVLNGCTSVTALRANFWHVPGLEGTLELE
ncbi:5'/3'-nucleotidase SurE [Aspergillus brunneoviolaceus CBS 621.78]|uniref:Sure-like protein n=1 Tax=Aspergillus brunneoviolaceus CBS 621.78 TaxID=1450534 RepID=A0ACD1GIW4_9EURO|nr:sure-like protein [Aspergillus brunneoviolaceus CBS 621.78]RAH49105.1 sure-like protein [Aspergillus brunneoviolaceus CBS 621.78]